ncbi:MULTISPECIES: glycosyltransferase family 2 protein [Streptococcus]|uniref:glycosyltransferase family 2 protein n=1 Tax=Streptococcus TaxID=1301 RepID=UPI0012B4FE02|nr:MULTISPECIES: glycosyltransferase family 2 protein [Streptococcus]MCY7153431.1 glycosyltransferase family 2 protein [Streptococcus mitis]BBP09694.1 glycosyl transferase [Streptococcus sp. 116-D4]
MKSNPIKFLNYLKKNISTVHSEKVKQTIEEIVLLVDSDDWIDEGEVLLDEQENIKSFSIDESVTLSVVYIVKNEENYILNSLESIDWIADEIVIVDTGSTDRTVEIIQNLSDDRIKLSHFKWNNDFSEARNFAIRQSKCDWILVLDADELLMDKKTLLKDMLAYFAMFENLQSTIFNLKIRRSKETYRTGKIFKNVSSISYKGKVHEVLTCEEKTKHINLDIEVQGENRVTTDKKELYNSLLLENISMYPAEPRWVYLYLRDNLDTLSKEDIIDFSKHFLIDSTDYYIVRIKILVCIKLIQIGHFEEFIEKFEEIEADGIRFSDFVFLNFLYKLLKLQNEISEISIDYFTIFNKISSFDCDDRIFSDKYFQSLLGTFLIYGGMFRKATTVYKSMLENDGDIPWYFTNSSLNDFLRH